MGKEFEKPSGARVLLPALLNALSYLTGVGREEFVERTKEELGIRARGRKIRETEGQFELRESEAPYNGHFGAKKSDIGPENV
jgi:hypothetical protein